jgi:hypothetical protein
MHLNFATELFTLFFKTVIDHLQFRMEEVNAGLFLLLVSTLPSRCFFNYFSLAK